MVAAGGGNYNLLQAAAAPVQLPAAGMLVSVVSLTARGYLPLGVDDKGEKVYAVYSNAQGGFEVHVPEGTDTNVMIVASVPGSKDAGLIYNAVTPNRAGAEATLVDEDAATVTRYLHQCFVQRLADILEAPDTAEADQLAAGDSTVNENPLAVALIKGMVAYLHAEGVKRGIPAIADPQARRARALALAGVVTDATFSAFKLEELQVDPKIVPRWADANERLPGFGVDDGYAIPVLRAAFRELRERAERSMRGADGRYKAFDERFFLQTALGGFPTDWAPGGYGPDFFKDIVGRYDMREGRIRTYPISKPGQVGDYLVAAYLGVGRPFVYEPVIATYMQLDDRAYPQHPTVFEARGQRPLTAPEAAAQRAQLAIAAARFPSLGLTEESPVFSVARRDAARRWARAYELVGFTLFAQLAYNVPDASSPAGKAVVEALRAYDAQAVGG